MKYETDVKAKAMTKHTGTYMRKLARENETTR